MDPRREFMKGLEVQRAAYRLSLPGRVAMLEATWRQLQAGDVAGLSDELRRIAHGLAGSGATFGMMEVSTAGRELEAEHTATRDLRDPEAARRIGERIAALRRVVERECR